METTEIGTAKDELELIQLMGVRRAVEQGFVPWTAERKPIREKSRSNKYGQKEQSCEPTGLWIQLPYHRSQFEQGFVQRVHGVKRVILGSRQGAMDMVVIQDANPLPCDCASAVALDSLLGASPIRAQ
jgi:hypothetical protein